MKPLLSLFALLALTFNSFAQNTQDICVPVKVSATYSPNKQINITWPSNANATSYKIYKKAKTDLFWNAPAMINGTASGYSDLQVVPGETYEYQIELNQSVVPAQAFTYIYAGLDAAPTHYRGKLILLIDNNYAAPLSAELKTLETDLISDGWLVRKAYARRNMPVDSVKQLVSAIYASEYSVMNSLLIVGHVPVPYSGNLNPDGHPDHLGAWPCDVYYGDIDGNWTDNSVNNVSATRPQNQNSIGDGKFDNSTIPSGTELNTARIDLYNMPSFALSDTELVRQYLVKDHNFKYGNTTFKKRMLIDDNFGYFSGEAFAQNGWRNGYACLGPDSIFSGDYFTDLNTKDYLWSYGTGGGTYTSAGGVGATTDYATIPLQNAFTMTFGSYFGDWDSQDNFLRAPLANSGSVLTNCWAGRPNWFFHYLGLGDPFSEGINASLNNTVLYSPFNYGSHGVHMGFMGDLSLRQDYFTPCSTLQSSAINNNSRVQLNWTANTASGVLGYYLYRSSSSSDSFQLVNKSYTTGTTYVDSFPLPGKNVYLLRAVRLEQTSTGTYYNLSLGRFDSIQGITPVGLPALTPLEANLYPNPAKSQGQLNLRLNQISSGTITLYNSLAQVQWQQSFNNSKQLSLNLPQLPAGIYHLHIQTPKHNKLLKVYISE